MGKQKNTGAAMTTRDKRNRKRYLCGYIQKHPDLTPADKAVGRLLVNWYNEKKGHCWASLAALAEELGHSRRTVQRAVKRLHRLAIVRHERGGGWRHNVTSRTTNKYYPTFELVTNPTTGKPRQASPPMSTSPGNARNTAAAEIGRQIVTRIVITNGPLLAVLPGDPRSSILGYGFQGGSGRGGGLEGV